MRPVDTGDHPKDSPFRKYPEAKPYLIERIGPYCSYCERKIPSSSLAVEHEKPKKHNPALELDWNNFLLACVNCNSTKGQKNVNLEDYFWPDKDNTFSAFVYLEDGRIDVSNELDDEHQYSRTKNTINLLGLAKYDLKEDAPRYLWRDRLDAFGQAKFVYSQLKRFKNKSRIKKYIQHFVIPYGHWSIFMKVFKNNPELKRLLIEETSGTCQQCFDADGNPNPRPGGNL